MPEEVAPVVAAAAVTLAGEADMVGVGIILVAEVAAMVEVVTAANPAEAEEVTVAKAADMAVKAMALALVIEHTHRCCHSPAIPL